MSHYHRNCGIVSDQKTVAHETLVINPGYVHITEQGKKWVERYMAEMAKKKVYSIGRYGAWTYCSPCLDQNQALHMYSPLFRTKYYYKNQHGRSNTSFQESKSRLRILI